MTKTYEPQVSTQVSDAEMNVQVVQTTEKREIITISQIAQRITNLQAQMKQRQDEIDALNAEKAVIEEEIPHAKCDYYGNQAFNQTNDSITPASVDMDGKEIPESTVEAPYKSMDATALEALKLTLEGYQEAITTLECEGERCTAAQEKISAAIETITPLIKE